MAKKDATPQKIDDPIVKNPKDPRDEIGSGILIDGKKMKATPPPTPASSPTKMAKGGVTRADGCVSKGHTKGRFV
jgi:hypothetical protein